MSVQLVAVVVVERPQGALRKGDEPMQATTTDKPVTTNRRAFRTPAGVLVAAETLQCGTRLYSPILATWARVLNDRLAA